MIKMCVVAAGRPLLGWVVRKPINANVSKTLNKVAVSLVQKRFYR